MKIKIIALVVFLICGLAVSPAAAAINWENFRGGISTESLQSYPYHECFKQAAEKYKIPLLMLLSIAKGESNFDTNAIGKKKNGTPVAYGVMQINYKATATDVGYKKGEPPEVLMNDPCRNINAGARYIAWLLKRYNDDIHRSIAAYYAGPNRVTKVRIPGDGEDYAQYIFRKLQSISTTPFRHLVYAEILKFDTFSFADNFRQYINKKDSSIPLEINKNAVNEYVVKIAAPKGGNAAELKKKVEKITGLKL